MNDHVRVSASICYIMVINRVFVWIYDGLIPSHDEVQMGINGGVVVINGGSECGLIGSWVF